MNKPIHTPQCFASHMGSWLIDPGYARQALAAIQSGAWKAGDLPAAMRAASGTPVYDMSNPEYPRLKYVNHEGVAVFSVMGAMAKARGKYAAVGTVQLRQDMRDAVSDQDVRGLLLAIDSPGGTVAGTQSLGDDIRGLDQIKPVFAHADDLIASAGYWTGSQARKLTASTSTLVGSLGTYTVIYDTSEQARMEGVKVHVISTGPYKGAGVDGAPVTPAQIADVQAVIDGLNDLFKQAVASGRRMDTAKVSALFDGRVHLAGKAKDLGLVDGVMSFDQALAEAVDAVRPAGPDNARRMRLAQASGR